MIEYFWMFNTLKMTAEKLNNPCIRISRLLSWMTTPCFHSKTPTETCWCPLDGHQDTIWPIKTYYIYFPLIKGHTGLNFGQDCFQFYFLFIPQIRDFMRSMVLRGTSIHGIPSEPRKVSPGWRLGWCLLILTYK